MSQLSAVMVHVRQVRVAGADAIVAQGMDAGGHGSSVAPLMTLLPDVVDLVESVACEAQSEAPTPVLAAGLPRPCHLCITA